MNSPFPGMNPYPESRWSDVHCSLMCFISETIQPQLPDDLRSRCHEIHMLDEIAFRFGAFLVYTPGYALQSHPVIRSTRKR